MTTESLGLPAVATATFTTPAGTTAYAANDIIAETATAANVNGFVFPVAVEKNDVVCVSRVRLKTTDTGFAGKQVTLHLFRSKPTVDNGDNGALGNGTAGTYTLCTESDKLDAITFTFPAVASKDGYYKAFATPTNGTIITLTALDLLVIYGILESVAAATPQGAKIWTCTLELLGRR
jgi:hypothetical protein